MYRVDIESLRARAAMAVVAVLAAMTASVGALAQDDAPFKAALLRNQAVVEAALYETTDGARVFVLDRTGEPPLLQFRGSFEIFALIRVPASRGDEILRVDTGENLVRLTPLGAVTLYPRDHPTGLPATRLGPAEPLPALASTAPDLNDALSALTAEAGEAEVDAPVAAASASAPDALLADAMRLTAEGLRASGEAPKEAEGKVEVTRIQFIYGADADARLEDGVLLVQINQDAGYAGRPSSLKIADAMLGGG